MNIKYPRTEIMVVLGSKVYPLYVTEPTESVRTILSNTTRESLLTFETAIKDNHGQGLWYPGCGENSFWTNWTVKKSAIKSFLNLPEPKVNIDYGYNSDEF